MIKRVLLAISVLMVVILVPGVVSQAANKPLDIVYLLVIDKLSINDINSADTPNLYRLAGQSAVGLQSNRTLGNGGSEDGALTLGAGNLAKAEYNRILAYNLNTMVPGRNQTAGEYYQNLTGANPDRSASVLVNLPELQQLLESTYVNTRLGALGDVLRQNNKKVSVIGNGDINSDISRLGVAIGMDAQGRVALGDVGLRTQKKVRDSYVNIQTNYQYINDNLPKLTIGASLVVIELSDLARLEKADLASPGVAATERKRLLYQLDNFVGGLIPKIPASNLVMVVSPSSPAISADNKDTFTPVFIRGPGFQTGAAYSAATQRNYVVANTDIAPTILQFLKLPIPSQSMIGRPIASHVIANVNHVQKAQQLDTRTALVNRLRVPLVKGYVVLQIVVIILALLAVLAWPFLRRYILPLVCSLVVIPLVLLLAPLTPLQQENYYILAVILASIVITGLSYFLTRGKSYRVFLALSVLTLLALDIDILTGTNLIRSSVLGYDPMAGARYYGIGNEYLGVLIGTSIITGIILFRRLPVKWALIPVALFFMLQSWLVAAPNLGAQSDGVITVPLAYLVTLILLAQWKVNWRTLAASAVLIIVLVVGLAVFDLSRPPALQTHIGRAASEIAQGGPGQAFTIIGRKLGMNLKLIRYTIWSRVFIVILATLAVLLYLPAGAMLRIKEGYPHLFRGFAGILTGAVVGGIINDSGIVAAATTSIYLVTPILLLIIKDNLIQPVKHVSSMHEDSGF